MKSDEDTIHLLLVDDERDYRETIAKRLRVRGFRVSEASNGKEALEDLNREQADVVVMDVKMPVMDGLEALEKIKDAFPKLEVILLTGHASPEDGVTGIKSGAFDYLCKPIKLEHLMSKVRQARDKLFWEEERTRQAEFKARMEEQMIATQRLASVGVMASGVAHEINNPLAIIQEAAGWMASLLDKAELADMPRKESFEKALEKIFKSVERAKKITHQLLGFVRKTESISTEVKLREFVGEVISLVEREAKDRDIQILADVQPDGAVLWTDPNPMRQVLLNLATNAIQACYRDGKVTILVRQNEHETTLSVKDEGEGIPKENLQRIFEPFFTTKPTDQGTGLGLFVSRNMVEKLGGAIEVESQLGRGSTFRVKLPRHPDIPRENSPNDGEVS
jgi:signal transduction histidine kinase